MTTIEINKSEKLFEFWCSENQWEYLKIPVENERTPDYKVKINNTIFYAEVKEILINGDELKSLKQLEERGWGDAVREEPGKTVREKIKDSYKQIKRFAVRDNTSGILVLYNNSDIPGSSRIDHYNVLTAMFGLQTVPVKIQIPISTGPDFLGAKKSVSSERSTYLSGILTLYEHYERGLISFFYHNPFAKFPIDYQLLKNKKCIQYKPNFKEINWDLIDI